MLLPVMCAGLLESECYLHKNLCKLRKLLHMLPAAADVGCPAVTQGRPPCCTQSLAQLQVQRPAAGPVTTPALLPPCFAERRWQHLLAGWGGRWGQASSTENSMDMTRHVELQPASVQSRCQC